MSNTDIARAGLSAWEAGDAATLSSLVADDFVLSGPVPQPLGKQEFLGLMQSLHVAMPDFAFNVSSFEENGDTVIAKTHITGTHTGVLNLPGIPPIPPTGIRTRMPEEVQTQKFRDGKMVSLTTNAPPGAGIPGMLAQLGVTIPT